MNKKLILQIRSLYSLLFAVSLSLSSVAAFAQPAPPRITITMADVPMERVIDAIEKQSSYLFAIDTNVNISQKVSVSCTDASVETALTQMVKGTDVAYRIDASNVVLSAVRKEVSAQPRFVSGKVLDAQGNPGVGAAVIVKGTTVGMSTGADGDYLLQISPSAGNAVLVVNYLGFRPVEVTVGNRTQIDFTLHEESQAVDAVVVTALGIKRSEKALSYNAQQVSSEDISIVKDVNLMNSLNGKIAGAVINSSASGIGGATRVVLRGLKSISSSNNALYVVDGIPLFNNNNGEIKSEFESQPRGEGLTDLNPDDIESMTVLTGPSAAALYGSSAANGVIVITTKKGKTGRPQISFSNQTTFSSPLKMPEFQTKYGNQPRTYSSWGGVLATPSSYNPQDFFNTAANTQTNASISVGNEKNQTYASLMHVYANGILPNNSYDKYSVTVRNTTSFLQDRMTLDAGFSYVETEDQNMLSAGRYFNPLTSLYTYPRGESVEDLMMFEIYDSNKKRYVQNWAWGRGALDMQNPLWMMHRNVQNNKRRRSMMNASLTYKVTDWLTLAGRAKADLSVGESSRKLYASTDPLFAGGDNGFFEFTKEEDTHRYGDFIATVNKHWEQFSLFANVGASISDQLSSIAGARGPLELPNFFSLTNTNPYGASGQRLQERKREQEQAVFASVEAGWRGMLYLTATVRNEWHSNLAYTNNLSYCFPSVGLSGLIHEMVKLPSFIDYLKVRASWAEVGSPIPWGISYLTYKWKQGSWSTSATRPIQNLRPENTTSWEVGLNARLFANSLSLDFTYYKSNTKHQTFLVPLSGSAGYENMYAQTGNVENKGFELSIGYDKTWRDFAWSSSLTLSHNKNKVVELMNNYYDPQTDKYYTLKEYEVASMGGANFIMTEGGTMGDLYAYGDLWLDENGYIYINPNDPKLMVTDERIKLGSVLPDYNAGFRNDFSYKGINLSLLFSARFGGIVVSPTQGFLDGLGVSKASADARDAGGVPINNGRIDAQHYYETVGLGQLLSHYTYSATNVRLQETSIGYTFPKKWMGDRVKLTASLVGRNLWMIYCKAPFDPELTASTGSYLQGIDYFMQPSLRSLGFNVQLKF